MILRDPSMTSMAKKVLSLVEPPEVQTSTVTSHLALISHSPELRIFSEISSEEKIHLLPSSMMTMTSSDPLPSDSPEWVVWEEWGMAILPNPKDPKVSIPMKQLTEIHSIWEDLEDSQASAKEWEEASALMMTCSQALEAWMKEWVVE